jgi:hypothetical protein
MTLVREQRDKVPMTVPVNEIMKRGRAMRVRWLIPGTAAALAIAAGVTVALSALTNVSHRPRHEPPAPAAAWTVAELADGNVSVTVHQLQDPAGLQRTLRADGVPASVTFDEQLNPACRPYPGGTAESGRVTSLLKQVFPDPYRDLSSTAPPSLPTPATATPASNPSPPPPGGVRIVINPAALPSGAGVQLASSISAAAVLLPQVVYASSQCTGG